MRTSEAHHPDTVADEATDESNASERPLQPIESLDISNNDFVPDNQIDSAKPPP